MAKKSYFCQHAIEKITTEFDKIADFRVVGRCLHKLTDILFIGLCTMICGGEDFPDMEEFGKEREEWLKKYIELNNGIPSHDTFERVFQGVDCELFRSSLYSLTAVEILDFSKELISIDGKKLRGESPKSKGTDGLYILTAWLCDSCVSIAEQKVEDKSNEIKAIPDLLDKIEIEGAMVSIDPIGCQTAIAELIVSKKADYLLGVKGNQADLLEEITESFSFGKIEQEAQTLDYGHGRIETRTCSVLTATEFLSPKQLERWKGVKSIIQIESKRTIGDNTSNEKRYYISSRIENADYFNLNVRKHWSIENKLHWNLDVIMNEDANRTRTGNAPQNLNTLRKLALALLSRKFDKQTKPKKMFKAALNTDYLEKILNVKF